MARARFDAEIPSESGPRETWPDAPSSRCAPSRSPGGRHPPLVASIVGAIETSVQEMVWVVSGTDRKPSPDNLRWSAEMLEEIAAHLQHAALEDRLRARRQDESS